jgi:hypothetical protein
LADIPTVGLPVLVEGGSRPLIAVDTGRRELLMIDTIGERANFPDHMSSSPIALNFMFTQS